MKTNKTIVIVLTLIFLLASCSPKVTQEPKNDPTALVPAAETTPYPIANQPLEGATYPIPAEQQTEVPAYMVPGFITMTPDAALTSVIVSEVRHENEVESIYITNISAATQDISNYMIYSPEMDARKIFPSNLILEPGESFVLYNGANLGSFPSDQQWLDTPVLIEVLDEVWLTNGAARIMYYFIYYPSITP